MHDISPPLVTVPEAAALLSVSRSKLYNLVATGALRPVKLGSSTRFRRADLLAFVASLPASTTVTRRTQERG